MESEESREDEELRTVFKLSDAAGRSLAVRQKPHEPCSLNCLPQHFLMPKRSAGVVPLFNIAEVIREVPQGRVVLPVDV